MQTPEFSTEFDVLFNNITSNQAPGLNEYEKSVFLTKAQAQLVNEYFNNRTDGVGGGYDGSKKRQYDFSSITRTERLFNVNTFKERINPSEKLDKRSLVFLFPQNYFLAVNEIISDDVYQYSVLPISYSEYQKLMLKPYNLPVKRGAWRLITDKKNCNYYREYVKTTDDDSNEIDSPVDYVIMSGWADNKRNIRLNIKHTRLPSESLVKIINGQDVSDNTEEIESVDYGETDSHRHPKVGIGDSEEVGDSLVFADYFDREWSWFRVHCDTGWDSSYMTYEVNINLYSNNKLNDEEVIEILKTGFNLYNVSNIKNYNSYPDYPVTKAVNHVDGLQMCTAPSKFDNFSGEDGKTFTTSCIQIPMVEIIGKFKGDIDYQLRYIRTLKPIILENLDDYGTDLSINGVKQRTECELPEEMHQEILERAVTLAKLAWQGSTLSQAASQQRSNNQ